MLRADNLARIWGPLMGLSIALLLCEARLDYSNLTGRYCASRYNELNCCPGRMDDCSVPILDTLCYCDVFCKNITGEPDCCPDYFSYCEGDSEFAPPPMRLGECHHNGRRYKHGSKFKDNCNTCMCSAIDNKTEILCETNECLMDQSIVDRVNNVYSTWVARNYSEFWGHTLDEGLQLRLGTLNPSKSVYRMNSVRRIYNPNDLPREFDSRIEWPRDISPIRDQGWCGASWAMSTVDVASDRFAILSKGMEKVQLSAQHLISCNNRGQQACNGGYLDRAWLFMRKFGLTDEDCYPWEGGKQDRCKVPRKSKLSDIGCWQRNSYDLKNDLYKVGPAYRLGNETDIMQEIITSGPVQATMQVHQDFFHYESGVYIHLEHIKNRQFGYHSVRIVGWGEEPSQLDGRLIKFWRVANSWGRNWGEDGYFKILRGTNECGIESFVLGVWAKTV